MIRSAGKSGTAHNRRIARCRGSFRADLRGIGRRGRVRSYRRQRVDRVRSMVVVAGDDPEPALFGFAAAGIEHRYRRFVDRQLGPCQKVLFQPLVKRLKLRRGIPHPERQRRAIKARYPGTTAFWLGGRAASASRIWPPARTRPDSRSECRI